MYTAKIENLWKTLTTNKIEFVGEISPTLLCEICKKVLIDPCISSCGCYFCFACISERLANEERECPGGKEACKEVTLEMDVNVARDLISQKDILKLEGKCPNSCCNKPVKLKNLRAHMANCLGTWTECPFHDLGCTTEVSLGEDIAKHMQSDVLSHSQLLIDCIYNVQNDVKKIGKPRLAKSSVSFHGMSGGEIIEQKLGELEDANQKLQKEVETNRKEICFLRLEIERLSLCLRKVNLIHDFEWKIEEFSKKQGSFYCSSPFYKDSYKLCLQAWIDGHNVHLYFYFLKGEHDNRLEWPMRRPVVLGIVNQYTFGTYKSLKFSHDTFINKFYFARPIKDRNESIGSLKASRSEINDTHGLLSCDSLLVSFSVIDSEL